MKRDFTEENIQMENKPMKSYSISLAHQGNVNLSYDEILIYENSESKK